MTALAHLPTVLTVEEAGEVLRCSRGSMYEAVRRGDVPSVKVGRSIRVPRHALEAMLGLTNDDAPGGQAGREVRTSTAAAGRDDAIHED